MLDIGDHAFITFASHIYTTHHHPAREQPPTVRFPFVWGPRSFECTAWQEMVSMAWIGLAHHKLGCPREARVAEVADHKPWCGRGHAVRTAQDGLRRPHRQRHAASLCRGFHAAQRPPILRYSILFEYTPLLLARIPVCTPHLNPKPCTQSRVCTSPCSIS